MACAILIEAAWATMMVDGRIGLQILNVTSATVGAKWSMAPPRSIPRYVTIHEAGHAVAYMHSGVYFRQVEVCVGGLSLGEISGTRVFQPLPGVEEYDDSLKSLMEVEVFHCLVGPFAEGRFCKKSVQAIEIDSPDDFVHAREMISCFTKSVEHTQEYLERMKDIVRHFVRRQDVERTVRAIARDLMASRTLAYTDVCRIASESGFDFSGEPASIRLPERMA